MLSNCIMDTSQLVLLIYVSFLSPKRGKTPYNIMPARSHQPQLAAQLLEGSDLLKTGRFALGNICLCMLQKAIQKVRDRERRSPSQKEDKWHTLFEAKVRHPLNRSVTLLHELVQVDQESLFFLSLIIQHLLVSRFLCKILLLHLGNISWLHCWDFLGCGGRHTHPKSH